jgi:hypothetical protein
VIATALLLAACGGSEETTESTPTATGIQYGGQEEPIAVERQPKARSTNPDARKGTNVKDTAGHSTGAKGMEKQSDERAAKPSEPKEQTGNSSVPARKSKPSSGCPKGLTTKQCAEVGRAYETSGNSRPVPADECPAAADAASCEQAGEAYAEAEDGSRPVQPNECPRAMSEEECRRAGEIYAEATK